MCKNRVKGNGSAQAQKVIKTPSTQISLLSDRKILLEISTKADKLAFFDYRQNTLNLLICIPAINSDTRIKIWGCVCLVGHCAWKRCVSVFVQPCVYLYVVAGIAQPVRMSGDGYREKWKSQCSLLSFYSNHKGNNALRFFYLNDDCHKPRQCLCPYISLRLKPATLMSKGKIHSKAELTTHF